MSGRALFEASGPVTTSSHYDVVIAGGGLAGLCLAIQLRRADESLRVLVADRSEWPLPEAAHKVGESSVESSSHYFLNTLGLRDLLDDELPKFGLRFFASHADNQRLEDRVECGPSHYLTVPSFQIDRGQFENHLAKRALAIGAEVCAGTRVSVDSMGAGDDDHCLVLKGGSERREVSTRWLVDATGRAGLLRKRFDSARSMRHRVNAAWFRVDVAIDLDDWSSQAEWRARVSEPRRLSTNHLMGEGYWVWLIPLAKGRTSVGIVADAKLHDFSELSDFDRCLGWLDRHESQLAERVRANLESRMDFRALKNYAHGIEQVMSEARWAVVGDAGIFVDPLYSPGSDFIGIANTLTTELIQRERRGASIESLAPEFDQLYRSLSRTFLVTYHRQYPLFGNPRIMSLKVVWDFAMYWGGPALLFCHDRLTDLSLMARARPMLQQFGEANVRMQSFFREWHAVSSEDPAPPSNCFVDYAEIGFLADLNRELVAGLDDDALIEALCRNVALAHSLRREIVATVTRHNAKLADPAESPASDHLTGVFETLYPDAQAASRAGLEPGVAGPGEGGAATD